MTPAPTVLGLPPALPTPLNRWRWLTDPVPAERAAALRIATGLVLLLDVLFLYVPHLRDLYGPDSFGEAAVVAPVFADSWRWSLLQILPATWGPPALAGLWATVAVALVLGYRPRITALVAWVVAVSFVQGNLYQHNGGDQLKLFLLLMLVFLPSDGCWAIRRHPAARRGAGPVLVQAWPLRLLMVQLALMYFMNGYYKAMGPQWVNGTVMTAVAANPTWARFSPNHLPLPDEMLRALTWATLAWELFFPLLVALPLTRRATLWIGVAFHLGTLIHLELGLFPLIALCYYVPLVPWERR
ncbi:MAG: HTTM domain-containing protein, partial [Zavarzinella sp.]|nr:HTTM domain-containing protein [Zavarzinella sp.]